MMHWKQTLIAGTALILLTNLVVLGGAAYNRSGAGESTLQLTQRELERSFSGKDNSGITLSLNWRLEKAELGESDIDLYAYRWGSAGWLDRTKLEQLGFDVAGIVAMDESGRHRNVNEDKEVLLVLEQDGAAYRRNLQRICAYAESSRKLMQEAPDNAELKRKAKSAEEGCAGEKEKSSRLFAIDAGLDLATLRAAYPDRNRYAIVHGLIHPVMTVDKEKKRLVGYITKLHAESINVPLKFRQVFEAATPFAATIIFGQRLEPWLGAAAKADIVKEGIH